ncbi:MAG: hypothetical protein EPN69_05010 [Rhodanobacter sp.]|nr:MAG: hypothetical protein EPN69_05010 [Rhodanobacter sp.]TAM05699.1 MAG: hypothetical protein EPN71_01635 [Rhodanobacter sp.]TAM40427.1 MAG: hypothetical protein EPN58_10505 [Rhodanobacter sp.]TAN23267.1 MAG: hypothetical protein EPN32_12190 [Rhodanobacter sp.]
MRKNVLVAALALGGIAFAGTSVAAGDAPTTAPAAQSQMKQSAMNWFGGESYNGAPALTVTAALVKAGGGASNFSFSTALVSMLGQKTVNAEVAKLTKQYGHENVTNFINGMTFAVNDGLKRATEAGVKLPAAPADLKGVKLAKTLVTAGTTADGTWWSGLLFDKALSHDIHVRVMQDIDAKYSHAADENTHKVLNQALYDVAQALKVKGVKLASLH